jgi:hypothetical protein
MKKTNSVIALLLLLTSISIQAQTELFIAKNGNDNNPGTILNPLATLNGARDKARSTGVKTIWIRGGRYGFDTTCRLDAQDAGITFSGYQNEKVIFDGSKFIDQQKFTVVTDGSLLAKLNDKAKTNAYSQVITDPALITLLKAPTSQISINDKMITLARFPNLGFVHVNNSTVSQEQANVVGTNTNPVGAKFRTIETIDGGKWRAEIARIRKGFISGYVSADWYKEQIPLNSANADGDIRLTNGSRYGFQKGSKINRFFVFNLLCELDEPGEWYFDDTDSRLYLWPSTPINPDMRVGVWAGPQCFEIRDAQNIKIKKITIQNIGRGNNGDGAINITGKCDNIEVAGVTFRFIAAPITAVNIWNDVTNSGVRSCDFYDVPNNSRLYGGKITAGSVEYGRNYIENCHFTEVYSKDFYGKACGISGAGNIFRNNLIHNMNGQPVTHAGAEHIIELNEVFNVGIEEGDGGAFYTGASIWSFGNVLRHNFVHHIMSVPQLLGRAAFFSDDLDAGETVIENVLYKGGWEAIKMNTGGGHTIVRNVLLECYTGIRNGDAGTAAYNKYADFLLSNPKSTDKENQIGRMLQVIGKPDWETGLTKDNWTDRVGDFWTNRYAGMRFLYKAYNDNNTIKAYECRFYDNLFYGNKTDINGGPTAAVRGSQKITLDLFADPANLNFKFKEPRPAYAPDIPFERIGLYKDEYRCAVPDKNTYRKNIKNRFANQASHTSDPYDYKTINQRLYYNTGKIIYDLVPCTNDPAPDVLEVDEHKFDLGTPASPVFNGYTRVSHLTTEADYGWTSIASLDSRDRGTATGANDINRDFVFSAVAKTFEAKVNNGTWKVVLTFGDVTNAHDNIQVKAEGQTKLTGINTTAGNFITQAFTIDVTDGKLSLEFSDQGGVDKNWILTRIWLIKENTALFTNKSGLQNQETSLIRLYPNPVKNFVTSTGHVPQWRKCSATGNSLVTNISSGF